MSSSNPPGPYGASDDHRPERPVDTGRRAVLGGLAASAVLGGLAASAGLAALAARSAGGSTVSGTGSDDGSTEPGLDAPARGAAPPYPEGWFRAARFGVMISFLGQDPGWNERVDAFDVEVLATQLAGAGVGYVMLTLGQNSGYHCSPNATYDHYTGYAAGDRSSRRDLPMDLAGALADHGVALMLYLPSRAPQGDPQALAGLSAHPENDQLLPAPQEFTRKWSEVIEEWSLRYGSAVRGWWFDGAYRTDGWDDLTQPYNWNTWAAACRAGNPASLLAFNRGLPQFGVSTAQQDYTAGEVNGKLTSTPETHPAPAGVQWHALGHIGSTWGFIVQDEPQHTDGELITYLEQVHALGGVVTLDAAESDGSIYGPHLRQLEAIGEAIRNTPHPTTSTTTSTTAPPQTAPPQTAPIHAQPTFTG